VQRNDHTRGLYEEKGIQVITAKEAKALKTEGYRSSGNLMGRIQPMVIEAATMGLGCITIKSAEPDAYLDKAIEELRNLGYEVAARHEQGLLSTNLVRFPVWDIRVSWEKA
jgi:hypothetical protein